MDTVSTFLLESKEGYCVHYATAMALMARIVGIPARVAVGYTGGTAVADGYEVTTNNAHAWPELYFAELGWLAFEPTSSVGPIPRYTDPAPQPTAPPENASPSPSAAPGQPSPDSPSASQNTISPLLWQLPLALLLLAGLAALPGLIRFGQRKHRLRQGQSSTSAATGAWAEVRASLEDRRISWPTSSPLLTAAQLVANLPAPAGIALLDIANIVQRVRYARHGASTQELAALVGQFRKALPERGWERFRIEMLPKSFWVALSKQFVKR